MVGFESHEKGSELLSLSVIHNIQSPLALADLKSFSELFSRAKVSALPSEPNSGLSDRVLPTEILPLQLWLKIAVISHSLFSIATWLLHRSSCRGYVFSPGIKSSL